MREKPSAQVICDSVSPDGVRLTTMVVEMHRFVLAEFNTHRVFSRNSASSRAIPFGKTYNKVSDDCAYPVYWGAEVKGMQSGDELDSNEIEYCKLDWDFAKCHALDLAEHLSKNRNLHKSLCNRLLEPFLWHTVVVTSTEWDNFFWQRCSPLAQPEMKAAADAMQLAYFTHEPKEVKYEEWHLPFIDQSDWDMCITIDGLIDHTEHLKQVSAARCARVSYETHKGIRDHSEDIRLYQRLRNADPMHASPFEHQATPFRLSHYGNNFSGNFLGWKQFRKEFPNENKIHFIPNHPLFPCSSCSSVGFEKMRGETAMGVYFNGCKYCVDGENI